MRREDIEDELLIERYLEGKLTDSEEEAFEEAYLGDPDLVARLELTDRLRSGLADLSERGELPRSRTRRWPAFLASPKYAAAASVLLAASLILSGVLYVENAALRDAGPSLTGAPVMRLVPLYSLRGADDANVITASGDGEWIVLLVDPGPADYERFRATVRRSTRESAEPVWQTTDLVPGYEDQLAVGVPGDRLPPGDYEVLVDGITDDGATRQVTRVTFRVEPAP